jgi:hypothetical protein
MNCDKRVEDEIAGRVVNIALLRDGFAAHATSCFPTVHTLRSVEIVAYKLGKGKCVSGEALHSE